MVEEGRRVQSHLHHELGFGIQIGRKDSVSCVGLPQRRATASEVATIAYCTYIPSMDPGHLYDGALTPAIQYRSTRSIPSLE